MASTAPTALPAPTAPAAPPAPRKKNFAGNKPDIVPARSKADKTCRRENKASFAKEHKGTARPQRGGNVMKIDRLATAAAPAAQRPSQAPMVMTTHSQLQLQRPAYLTIGANTITQTVPPPPAAAPNFFGAAPVLSSSDFGAQYGNSNAAFEQLLRAHRLGSYYPQQITPSLSPPNAQTATYTPTGDPNLNIWDPMPATRPPAALARPPTPGSPPFGINWELDAEEQFYDGQAALGFPGYPPVESLRPWESHPGDDGETMNRKLRLRQERLANGLWV